MLSQRFTASRDYLKGEGIEIGAGPNPQPVPEGVRVSYFDIRDEAELSAYIGLDVQHASLPMSQARQTFPEGADFLIAHHVLEHSADPIGTLRQWMGLVKPGGVICYSTCSIQPEETHYLKI